MNIPIVSRFPSFQRHPESKKVARQCDLHTLYLCRNLLPRFVQESPIALHCLELLGPLAWDRFPERDLERNWGQTTIPYAALAASCLFMLEQGFGDLSRLHRFLVQNPPLVWLFGFPVAPARQNTWGFDAQASLPTHRHFTRMLRTMPNSVLQHLLSSSITSIVSTLQSLDVIVGDCISGDTKHILAWVRENNPKAYLREGRYDKNRQPKGDPDCRLGCKRRHNQKLSAKETPSNNPVPAASVSVGEFYWGYASGIIATKAGKWGEFILAELTQPFDCSDVSYFFPLMQAVEQRLGFRPPYGTFDAAYDAFYVYEYFHEAGGFAAVPFSEKGGYTADGRKFSRKGLPLCQAGLPMPLKTKFTDRTRAIIEHQRGKYACPLLFPEPSGNTCPIDHKNWAKNGCTADMPLSIGARLRYTLKRDTEEFEHVYKQRTAAERIFSRAVQLGIERPHLRNGKAIANINTLIYVLVNLRTLWRITQRQAEAQ